MEILQNCNKFHATITIQETVIVVPLSVRVIVQNLPRNVQVESAEKFFLRS